MCSDLVVEEWGYFGKVPSKGDFIYSGVDPEARKVLFDWQEAVLTVSREQLCEEWVNKFLNAPIWHFAMTYALDETKSHIGTMIPSVDNSGRYFFFTLIREVETSALGYWLNKDWSKESEITILQVLEDEFDLAQWKPTFCKEYQPLDILGTNWANQDEAVSDHLVLKREETDELEQWVQALVDSSYLNPIYWWTEGSYCVEPHLNDYFWIASSRTIFSNVRWQLE